MIGSNSMSFFLHAIPLLFFSTSSFLYTSDSLTQDLCRPDQRDTLLEFKNEFEFEIRNPLYFHDVDNDFGDIVLFSITCYPKMKSWGNDSDCCRWDGITCDVNSGVVIGLDLSCSCLHGHFKPNSSLLRLKYLRNLNLAYNNFTYSPIPTGLNKLTRLEILNISQSSFFGQIPREILHLTKLVSLDLSSTFISYHTTLFIRNPFLRLLAQNLTNLRELDMSFVNISSKIPGTFSNLTSLRSLRFRECFLFGRLTRNVLLIPTIQSIDFSYNPNLECCLPEFSVNNSLVLLDLSQTSLSGNIPDSINNLKHLNALRFRNCTLTGKIPLSIGNLSHLTSLILSSNNFGGKIPSSLQNLNRLTKLAFSNNHFTGTLPPDMSSLSNLELFDASDNSFVGIFPTSLFTISSLYSIYLSNNQLNGTLESANISSPSKLEWLCIGRNNLRGPIPRSISKLVNLETLDLSHLNTQGPVDFSIFSHLKSLTYLYLSHLNTTTTIDLNAFLSHFKELYILDLSGNHVSATNMSRVLDSSLQLGDLNVSGCGIREFPEFIRTQRQMSALDLSNNRIKDQVPGWLWSLPELRMVHLSNNSFSGFDGFTRNFSRAQIKLLDLSKNNLSGEIPKSICDMSSLKILDLSNNNFSGSIPHCFNIFIKRDLWVLNLCDNHLKGEIPEIFFNGSNLSSLNVGHNQLVGKLPRSLSSCSSLEVVRVDHNRINDTFPFWLESLQKLQVLVLHSNEFHGSLQYHPRVASWFPQLRIIDISYNAFTGTIPSDFFMYWSAMFSNGDHSELRYIGDNTYYQDSLSLVLMNKGVEMKYTRILTLLTAIDFSGNRLRGKIPESIGLLKNLKVLNLSSNGFGGNIPSSLENLTELESLDLSHNKLSGQIPPALANLKSLEKITVSHNQLVGPIPQSAQFDTQDALSFEGNPGLCGRPLTTSCGDVGTEQSQEAESDEAEEEEVLSWTAAAIALAPGVIFGLTVGHVVFTLKPQWFMKISCVMKPRRRGRVSSF